ncbi:MAG: DMT family transporter [Gammaproteobacteria bacterium]|nr:DMT family transporter [Gammaproteobacteria bacterium]
MNVRPASNDGKAFGYAALTIVFWSTVASAFALTLRHVGPFELLFYSSLFAMLLLGVIVLLSPKKTEFRRWTRRDFGLSAVLGLLNPFLYYLLLFEAYDRLPAQEALPLNFAWPIVLVLLSIIILRQKIGASSVLFLLVSFLGVIIIATRGAPLSMRFENPAGVGMALGSTVIWALYWIYSSKDERDSVCRLFCNFVFGVAYLLLFAAFNDGVAIPGLRGLAGTLYIATFEMALAFVCWLQALKLASNTAQVSSLIYITPFFSLLVIHYAVGEQIYSSTMIGLLLIIGGIVGQQWIERRKRAALQAQPDT